MRVTPFSFMHKRESPQWPTPLESLVLVSDNVLVSLPA